MWHVYRDDDGTLVSIGTILADPLPKGLTAIDLPRMTNDEEWDPKTLGPVPKPPPEPDVDRTEDFLAAATVIAGKLTEEQQEEFKTLLGDFLGPYRFRDASAPADGLKSVALVEAEADVDAIR